MLHKYVMDDRIIGSNSKLSYLIDVSIYKRLTEELVAVGMQNKNETHHASDDKSLREFLTIVEDLRIAHPQLQGAYYTSSYGYKDKDPAGHFKVSGRNKESNTERTIDIKFFEYKDNIYFEWKFP